MYVNNQETVFEHTNFRRTSVKGDLDEWVRQKKDASAATILVDFG